MELAPEEFVGSNNNNDESQSHLIIKGKRTKRRHRSPSSPSPPALLAATSSSSSATAGADEYFSLSSPTTSSGGGGCGGEIYESTEEEEDMANCLILLAQGDHPPKQIEKLSPTTITTTTTTTTTAANASFSGVGKAGFFVYECKTCNRTFPSFQALGGHRASHKKPRAAMVEDKKASPPISTNIMDVEYEEVVVFNKVTTTCNITAGPPTSNNNSMPLQQIANAKALIQRNKVAKIHECSICGSEFTSGQALGGHMRRHRATPNAQSLEMGTNTSTSTSTTRTSNSSMDEMKQRNILALDLNLPAPEDDHHRESNKFQFVPTQQALVFSAPALVDCHY